MTKYKNKITGVVWDITDKRSLEIAEINTDLEVFNGEEEVSQAPQEPQTPAGDALDGMEKKDLLEMAKGMEITGTSKMNVEELKAAIRNHE